MPEALLISSLLLLSHGADTVLAPSIVVSAKHFQPVEKLPVPVSEITLREGVENPKDLSARVPGFFMPAYGSSMTSSIYFRGFGSRIDSPVLSLYVDRVPVLDKNAYDMDFVGASSVRLFRGPQGSLYGRNALGGVMDVRTVLPEPGCTLSLEGGSAGYCRFRSSTAWNQQGLHLGYRHSDGYFTNIYTGRYCDPQDALMLRHRFEKPFTGGIKLENTLSVSASREGGYAYAPFMDGKIGEVAYNDDCGYSRLYLSEATSLIGREWQVCASLQGLFDRMEMDNDFTPRSIFTLEQAQSMGGATLEAIWRPSNHPSWWKPAFGGFLMGKYTRMHAPVHFLPDGVQELILDHANAHIPASIGTLRFQEDQFVIDSDFSLARWNAALYHASLFSLGRWTLTAGLRLDYEGGRMGYDSHADLHYQLVPLMAAAKAFRMDYTGSIGQNHLEVLPDMSVFFDTSGPEGSGGLFARVAKGHKAGGFNTQIFSDILQQKMMLGMMEDLGVYFQNAGSIGPEATEYRPEEAWNFELGFKYARFHGLSFCLNAFYIDCRNQQLTVFPPGKNTGRMMTNAGRSASLGVEADIQYGWKRLNISASYGWTRARFLQYTDGIEDYSGNILPYSPEHSLHASVSYRWDRLSLGADLRGAGPIRWDEGNTLVQSFYLLPGAFVRMDWGRISLFLRGDNLSGTEYATFYFKSMGHSFFSRGLPRRYSVGLTFHL